MQGEWYHYVVTIGPDEHHAYINGEEHVLSYNAGTTADDYGFFASVTSNELLAVGKGVWGPSHNWWRLNGAVDDVRVYDYELSEEEVITLYESTVDLISPANEYVYEVWSPLYLEWQGAAGFDGMYYLETELAGSPYAPFSGIALPLTSISLQPAFVDMHAHYGKWRWRIYTKDGVSGPYHYSDWWTIFKNPPELLAPADGVTVDNMTQFTWNKVASVDPPNTWYIAKLTGAPFADPLYMWWLDADQAILPPAWYAILVNLGGGEFNWSIAATSGDPSTPGGLGMTSTYAAKVKFPPGGVFYVE